MIKIHQTKTVAGPIICCDYCHLPIRKASQAVAFWLDADIDPHMKIYHLHKGKCLRRHSLTSFPEENTVALDLWLLQLTDNVKLNIPEARATEKLMEGLQ